MGLLNTEEVKDDGAPVKLRVELLTMQRAVTPLCLAIPRHVLEPAVVAPEIYRFC
jgi:hypothetical protein